MSIYLKLPSVIILAFVLFFSGMFFNPLFNEKFTTYALIVGLSTSGLLYGWILSATYRVKEQLDILNYIKIHGSLLGLAFLFGTGYIFGSPESSVSIGFGFFFLFATWLIIDPIWELHYYAGEVKTRNMPFISMSFNLVILGLMVLSIVYAIDRASFVNYGSIRPVKDASKEFKTLDELSASCKAQDKYLVLQIVKFENGTAQARCEMQLFAQTWDVTQLLKDIHK